MPLFDFADLNEENAKNQFEPYEILTHPDGSFVELGRGSMGTTYQAVDTTLQFPVALKVIDFKAAGVESNRERFLREARAAAKLRHPNVASVLYYGGRLYGPCFYAMEFVEGETLAERVERTGPLSTRDALAVIAQVANALEAAEKHGLVHRDLKPANLMLLNGPEINVKVIDFGLAKVLGHQEPTDRITYDGFIGTPAFASPEQFSGAQIDQRSDYFSLGSTLVYLLTGHQPFKADHVPELAEQMVHRGTGDRQTQSGWDSFAGTEIGSGALKPRSEGSTSERPSFGGNDCEMPASNRRKKTGQPEYILGDCRRRRLVDRRSRISVPKRRFDERPHREINRGFTFRQSQSGKRRLLLR